MEILRCMGMFLITNYRCICCSIRVQKVLSAHVLYLFLINIKINPFSCVCANMFFNNETAAQFTQEFVYVIVFYTHIEMHE